MARSAACGSAYAMVAPSSVTVAIARRLISREPTSSLHRAPRRPSATARLRGCTRNAILHGDAVALGGDDLDRGWVRAGAADPRWPGPARGPVVIGTPQTQPHGVASS